MNRAKVNPPPRESEATSDPLDDDDDDSPPEEDEETRARKLAPVKLLTEADIARLRWEMRNVDRIEPMLKKWHRVKERLVRPRGVSATLTKLSAKSVSSPSVAVEPMEEGYEEIDEEQEREWSEEREMDEAEEDHTTKDPEIFDFDDFDDFEAKEEPTGLAEEKSPEELYSPTSSSFSDTDKEEENESTSEIEEEVVEKEELDDGALLAPFIAELSMTEDEIEAAKEKRLRESTIVLNEGRDDILYHRDSYVSARNPSTTSDSNFEIVLSSSDEEKVPKRTTRLYHKLRLVGDEIVVARDHRKALKNKQDEGETKFEQKEFNEIDFSKLKRMGYFFNEEFQKKKQIYDKFRVHHVKKTVETMMEEIEGGTPEELAKKKEFESQPIVKPGLRKKMWQRMVQPHLIQYSDFIDSIEYSIERETEAESFHESPLGGVEGLKMKDDVCKLNTSKAKRRKKRATCFYEESEQIRRQSSMKNNKPPTRRHSIKAHFDSLKMKDMKFKDGVRRSLHRRSTSEFILEQSQGKPYHLVCRDRIKRTVKAYRAMFRDELELLAKGQTFALRGVQIQRQFEVGIAHCRQVLKPWTYKERQRIENILAS